MEQRQKSYLLNAFLLGVITGFFIAPLKNGIQVHVISRGTCSPEKGIGHNVCKKKVSEDVF